METHEVLSGLSVGPGPEWTRWTARLVVACWVGSLLLSVVRAPASKQRLLWTAGLIGHLGHVFCAFHFMHGWSHSEAVLHTARLTERVTGWAFGQGVWINYAFTLAWFVDVVCWWCRRAEASRPRAWSVGLNASFAFLFVNATVVFGPWWWKWVGVLVLLVVGVVWRRQVSR